MRIQALKSVARMAYNNGYETYINRSGPYVPIGYKIANESWLCGYRQAQQDESGKTRLKAELAEARKL